MRPYLVLFGDQHNLPCAEVGIGHEVGGHVLLDGTTPYVKVTWGWPCNTRGTVDRRYHELSVTLGRLWIEARVPSRSWLSSVRFHRQIRMQEATRVAR